ncbi:hypothetical protein LCGC14_0707860, partial [marine sediment metagenome]
SLQWIPVAGQILGPLAYMGVYTLMTKFSIDLKRHKTDSMQKAFTFTPVSLEEVKIKSLNERSSAVHGYWDDSIIAALIGHPNAYYTTVLGEAEGQTYTAQAIISPHSLLRDNPGNQKGFADFIWQQLWAPGDANPDLMIGLGFDNLNLDYFLLTSELSALNDDPDYSFKSSAYDSLYAQYKYTTLGYLQQKIAEESSSKLSLIKPIIVDGKPEYIFVDGTDGFVQLTMPASTLYQPIIVHKDKTVRNEGTITVNIKTAYTINTKGIDHQTAYPEKSIYPSKIPLSSHNFGYPITSIKLEFIEVNSLTGELRVVDSVIYTSDLESFGNIFNVEYGNVYFVDDIDTMIISDKEEYDSMINSGLLSASSEKYYTLTFKFDLIVPDSGSEEHQRIALTQATAYSIMDYMNQYTFAKTTADMIAEIAYTETLTLISSSISAATIVLGSWAIMGLSGAFAAAGVSLSKQLLMMASQFGYTVVVGSLKEMFEEIIVDGFLETWGEKWIKSMGYNDDIAFWFTSLLTSGRETLGGLRSVIQKGLSNTKIGLDIRKSVNHHFGINQNSDTALQNEFIAMVNEANTNEKGKIKNEIDKIKSWKQIAGSGFLGLMLSIIPAIFTGGMFFSNFMSTMGIVSQIEGLFGDIIARSATKLNLARMTGGNYKGDDLSKIIQENTKFVKPKVDDKKADLDKEYLTKNLVPITAIDISVIFDPDFGYETVWVENEYFSPKRFSDSMFDVGRLHIDYDEKDQPLGQDVRKPIEATKTRQRKIDAYPKEPSASGTTVSISSPATPIPSISYSTKWKVYALRVTLIDSTSKPNTAEIINTAQNHFSRDHGLYRGIKMGLVWTYEDNKRGGEYEYVFHPKAFYTDTKGNRKTMENKPLYDILTDMGLDASSLRKMKLVPIMNIINNPNYKNYIPDIFSTSLFSKDLRFTSEAARDFYNDFAFYYKNQFDKILKSQEDVKIFEDIFRFIFETSIESIDRFSLVDDLVGELQYAQGHNNLDSYLKDRSSVKSSFRNHFNSYFAKSFQSNDIREAYAYNKLVDSLFASFTFKRFQNVDYQNLFDTLWHQTKFAVMSTVMEKAGIFKSEVKNFPQLLEQFMANANNKKMIKDIFTSEEGKQLIFNSLLTSFLIMPGAENSGLFSVKAGIHFGFIREVMYNLNRLSNRISRMNGVWDQLLQKIATDPKLTIEDLYNTKIHDRIYYGPQKTDYPNKFGLNFNNIKFYSVQGPSRIFDGLGLIEFTTLGLILITEIKSTMFESIFEADRTIGGFVNDLINDGLSSRILSLTQLFKTTELNSIIDMMVDLPTVDINLVAALIKKVWGYLLVDGTSEKALESIRNFLKKYYEKTIDGLRNKLEDHELFIVKLTELINLEIISFNQERNLASRIASKKDLESFLIKLFKKNGFKESVQGIANKVFKSEYFKNQLKNSDGFKDLLNFLLDEENFKKMTYEDWVVKEGSPSTSYGLGTFIRLTYEQDPHFKLDSKLSVSDFPGQKINFYTKNKIETITTDAQLKTFRNNYPGALTVYHDRERQVYLVPNSQITANMRDSIRMRPGMPDLLPGYLDEDGNTHINIFVADGEGYKLASKFIFTESGFRIHKNPHWADAEGFTKNFQFDTRLYLDEGIFIYRTNYYSAMTFIVGDTIITGIQNINLNLEHLDPTPQILPDLPFRVSKWARYYPNVRLRQELLSGFESRVDGAAEVIFQLDYYPVRRTGTSILIVNNGFLNLHSKVIDMYTITKFKSVLSRLGLQNSDFDQITRGYLQSDGGFHVNNINKYEFYIAWLNIMKSGAGVLVFSGHPSLSSITPFLDGNNNLIITDNDIAIINTALIDIFGYTAFVCLLAGIMTFRENSADSQGYKINFLKHDRLLQTDLLRNFVGRSFERPFGDITESFLISNSNLLYYRTRYWWSLFSFGFIREQIVYPSGNYFADNYFSRFEPETTRDYRDALDQMITKSFSGYASSDLIEKEVRGRIEIVNFLLEQFEGAYRSLTPMHSGQKIFLVNQLIKNIILPETIARDFTVKLLQLQMGVSKSTSIKLGTTIGGASGGAPSIQFEVNDDLVIERILGENFKNSLTIDALYTMIHSYSQVGKRNVFGVSDYQNYFLDFDLPWNDNIREVDGKQMVFKDRFIEAHNILLEAIQKIPATTGTLKVELYGRSEGGINKNDEISAKPSGIYTQFGADGFEIDLANPSEGIISLLLWMMLEPNMFSVIKWNGNNFLYLDIYGIYGQDHINTGTIDSSNQIEGSLIWGTSVPGFTDSDFNQIKEKYNALFELGDILHFLGFHNHERDGRFNGKTIIDYIKDIVERYATLRLDNFNDESELVDLR